MESSNSIPPTPDMTEPVIAKDSIEDAESQNTEVERHPPTCGVCCQIFEETIYAIPCDQCKTPWCQKCIRKAFLSACTGQLPMPPRCCKPLNIGIAFTCLTTAEIDEYHAKYEELNTIDPVYCPVPTCSVFIPYRLFPKHAKENKGNAEAGPDNGMQATNPEQHSQTPQLEGSSPNRESIPCPACETQICCECKLMSHPESPCVGSAADMNPDLSALLRKWNIKRCPRCRTGIKKMYGCDRIRCRCGYSLCWVCCQGAIICEEEGCEQDPESDGSDDANASASGSQTNSNSDKATESEDLDASDYDNWEDNDRFDFGEEMGETEEIDRQDCDVHEWTRIEAWKLVKGPDDNFDSCRYQCEKCRGDIIPTSLDDPLSAQDFDFPPNSLGLKYGSTHMTGFYCNTCYWVVCSSCRDGMDDD